MGYGIESADVTVLNLGIRRRDCSRSVHFRFGLMRSTPLKSVFFLAPARSSYFRAARCGALFVEFRIFKCHLNFCLSGLPHLLWRFLRLPRNRGNATMTSGVIYIYTYIHICTHVTASCQMHEMRQF